METGNLVLTSDAGDLRYMQSDMGWLLRPYGGAEAGKDAYRFLAAATTLFH
jgi:hypothetical protein